MQKHMGCRPSIIGHAHQLSDARMNYRIAMTLCGILSNRLDGSFRIFLQDVRGVMPSKPCKFGTVIFLCYCVIMIRVFILGCILEN